jgi:cyclopropane fatty-acyl-phospholipid synthase-like methyltransferase
MPLPREIEYWDGVAKPITSENGLKADNLWKRRHQVERLLRHPWIGQKVLEIGVGNGIVAGTLQMVMQGHWTYTGTELSPHFRKCAASIFQLNTVEADVRELPGDGYTRIIALDALEHVRPEHREEGYARIAAVAAPGCLLFIHYSHSESHHLKEFDHPFGLEDLVRIQQAGFSLRTFERYACEHPNGTLDYVFAVMKRNDAR